MSNNKRGRTRRAQDAACALSRLSGEIFSDIKFIRLSQWRECRRSTVLDGDISCGGQIYRRFKLNANANVMLEFWSSGFSLKEETADHFLEMLNQEGKIDLSSLVTIAEVLGLLGQRIIREMNGIAESVNGKPVIAIDDAEVGEIHGRRVLAVWWRDLEAERNYLSIYMNVDGDQSCTREIHFSAPSENIEKHATTIVETLRSFQWNRACPPPIG